MDTRPDSSPLGLGIDVNKSDRFRHSMRAVEQATFDLKRVAELLRRRLSLVVACTAFGGALAVLAAFFLLPSYTAVALLSMSEAEFARSDRGNDAFVDTQLAMLQSDTFLRRVFAFISRDVRLNTAIPSVADLERRLTVMQTLRSRIITVAFTARSPMVAADVANAVVRLYTDARVLQDADGLDDIGGRLTQQIAALEDQLQSALKENALTRPDDAASSPAARVEDAAGQREFGDLRRDIGPAALSERIIRLRAQIDALKVDQDLARRKNESEQQTQATSPPVQLAALALPPQRPSSARPITIVIPATIASAIFGAALALLLGRLDPRIYTAADLRTSLSTGCVGAVPRRRRSNRSTRERAGYVRAVEAVVTTMLLAPRTEPRLFVIASSVADDGKSEFALNFAAAAARMGRRVLLIDFDTVGSSAGLHWLTWREAPGRPGIFDVLANAFPAGAAITRLPDSSVDWLPRGDGPFVDPLALVANGRLTKAIDQLGRNYDWIVVNSLPTIGVSESRIIASIADDVLLVARSGVTTFPNVEDAVELLSTSISFNHASDGPPRIATVLIDAPEGSLPRAYRDKTKLRRASFPTRPSGALPFAAPLVQAVGSNEPGAYGAHDDGRADLAEPAS